MVSHLLQVFTLSQIFALLIVYYTATAFSPIPLYLIRCNYFKLM